MSTIRFALIGCGRIAKKHAELLGTGQIPGAGLAAVCDIDEAKAAAVGERYRVPHFIDMDAMLEEVKEIDAVSVLTPSGLHAEHTIRMAASKKHVVVEKPMALSLHDADDMIRACDENGVRLFVVKQNRFNVPVVKLREAMEERRFGKIVMATVRVRWCRTQEYYDSAAWRGTWALDGGVFTNQASHHIDLLEWMVGGAVESVFAKSTTALVDIETEDTGVAILKFASGTLGLIEATTATRPRDQEGSLSILGEKGMVEIGGLAVNQVKTWRFAEERESDRDVVEKFSVNPPDVYGFGHKIYYEHVIHCLQHDRKALVDGLEGRKSLELISAIYESIESGKEISLRFKPKKCRLGQRCSSNTSSRYPAQPEFIPA